MARFYLTAAYNGYVRWGATAKAAMLADRYPELRLVPTRGARGDRAPDSLITTSTTAMSAVLLDVGAVIRTAQTLAGEVQLSRVIDRLMRIATENAGAQKAVLLLHREGRLTIEAIMRVDPDRVDVGLSVPVEESVEVPLTVVQYVARTGEAVLLGDAAREGRFAGDPYIAAHRTQSILCLSMSHQARLTGVLYLENNITNEAFTPARLELLGLLLMQAATAVENAQLYAHVQRRTEELRDTEERLQIELAERARAEEARAALQEEIIRVQNARLAELSTPLIPITEGVMVMPLIGTMDAQRAGQVLDTALHGVGAHRARVVILDITGVKLVDTNVAATLMRTATALRLLGAQTIITGIRPEVAQTLVGLDVDMSSIVTKGTLQSGIAHALGRLRR
jgi:anti-anti-sigma regulatory factor